MRQDIKPFLDFDFAHRGLFRSGSAVEENTLPAISAAIDNGFAVEIDIQCTLDDQAVVFHDATLERLTTSTSAVMNMGSRQLKQLKVGASDATIPGLIDALDLIDGQVPVLIEIKRTGKENTRRYGTVIRRALEGYTGPHALISFDADIIAWFKKHWPAIPAGLIFKPDDLASVYKRFVAKRQVKTIHPDLIAVNVDIADHPTVQAWRSERTRPILCWTVRDQRSAEIARKYADAIIFEEPDLIRDGTSDA